MGFFPVKGSRIIPAQARLQPLPDWVPQDFSDRRPVFSLILNPDSESEGESECESEDEDLW